MKTYTDLEQSKRISEILPLESADMGWNVFVDDSTRCLPIDDWDLNKDGSGNVKFYHAWSLTALLDVMPKDKSIECSISFGYYNGKGEYIEKWLCAFEKEGETTDDYIIETIDGNNPVDACVAMIERLHELNLL